MNDQIRECIMNNNDFSKGNRGGYTAILIQKILDYHGSRKELHVYDSFEGFPTPPVKINIHQKVLKNFLFMRED